LRAAVWDPIAGTITVQSVASDMFCSGMVVLPDGRPFINGGTLQYDPFYGQLKSSVFDLATNTFTDITGTGFLAGATVKIGGTSASAVTVVGSTSITATTAAHAAGAVNVVVTNSDSQSGTLTIGYTYTSSTGGGGSIGFVQVNAATPQTASAAVLLSYGVAQTAGNLNIVAIGWNDTTSTVSSVTDSRGNKYTQAGAMVTGTGLRQAIYYAKNIAAGSNTVTVSFNQAAAFVDVRILEYSGLDTSSPLDVTAGAAGSGTSMSSGAATTTSAKELIFGAGTTVDSVRRRRRDTRPGSSPRRTWTSRKTRP